MLSKTEILRRKAFEKLYDGLCTVEVKQEVTRENGSTGFENVVILENEPCRLSISSSPVSVDGGAVMKAEQNIKLFLSPSEFIPEGSKVTVTQYGVTKTYKSSGMPVVRDVIQSIELEVLDNEC